MLFIYLLSETFFSSSGNPWCFMITIPEMFIQDRRLEVARGFPDPLTDQMFHFWKSPLTQWQVITLIRSCHRSLLQGLARLAGVAKHENDTHLWLELQCLTKAQVSTEELCQQRTLLPSQLCCCSDSSILSSVGWVQPPFSEGHCIMPGTAALQRHQ